MIKIYIPWPPSALSPNNRMYWRQKNPIKTAYRDQCVFLARPFAGKIPQGLTRTTFIFYPPDNHARDLDNCLASIKSGVDGVCHSLGINDKWLRPITLDWGSVKRGGEIEITLEPYKIDITA